MARLVMKEKRSCEITNHLKHLHWLPVKFRIEYKILLMVFKCLHGEGPSYLASLLEPYCPPRRLRSSDKGLLVERKTERKYGDRAFSVAGPKLWKDLPEHIRESKSVNIFKKSLKTYYFRKAYQ